MTGVSYTGNKFKLGDKVQSMCSLFKYRVVAVIIVDSLELPCRLNYKCLKVDKPDYYYTFREDDLRKYSDEGTPAMAGVFI